MQQRHANFWLDLVGVDRCTRQVLASSARIHYKAAEDRCVPAKLPLRTNGPGLVPGRPTQLLRGQWVACHRTVHRVDVSMPTQ